MKHVLSVQQFADKALLEKLFTRAAELQAMPRSRYPKPLKDKIIATVFYEPSTRTRLSFEAAIQKLGGQLLSVENAADSASARKGETLEDTVRIVNGYADAMVLRHPEVGAAERAAAVSGVPIINAGDGAGEHPTQGLLDAYTIFRERKSLEGLKVAFVGDLLNGRTLHSSIPLLSQYKLELSLISPPSLRLPQAMILDLKRRDVPHTELDSWETVVDQVDVLYMTRVQKERFASAEEYEAVKDSFILTQDTVNRMRKNAVILHPLPRVNEIAPEVDTDPRAAYFRQAENGLYVRMALLEFLFSG